MARRRVAWNGGRYGGRSGLLLVGCGEVSVEEEQRGEGREVRVRSGRLGASGRAGLPRGGFSWAARVGCCWFPAGDAVMTGMGADRGWGWRVLAMMSMPAMQSGHALIALQPRMAWLWFDSGPSARRPLRNPRVVARKTAHPNPLPQERD